MERKTSQAWTAAGALCGACGQGKGACAAVRAGELGTRAESSAQGNAAPEGGCVATSGPAAEAPHTFLTALAGAEKAEEQSQDPEGGSQIWGSGLVVHWGAPGSTGVPREESEEGACHLGGWR